MADAAQGKTFTVPVGTRLSNGIELEFLVAYLHASDPDPDEANAATLSPILRVEAQDHFQRESAVQAHLRATLRDHGIQVAEPTTVFTIEEELNVPHHLAGRGVWEVGFDSTVWAAEEEAKLVQDKSGAYGWLAVELRSPAFWDDADAHNEIHFVVNLLKSKYRVRVNPSCGFHVHVGNGPRHFDARTLKRFAAFAWAADPILSRLHAPWRRVCTFGMSVRYGSRLACVEGIKATDAQRIVREVARNIMEASSGRNPLDPIPVVPWSDRSKEEKDYGGASGWERHAFSRVKNGPWIALNERLSDKVSGKLLAPSRSHMRESYVRDNDNEGGAHYRRLLDFMKQPAFRALCVEGYGHDDPEALGLEEQYVLLAIAQCGILFGHPNLSELSETDLHRVVLACGPYIEIAQTGWEWDANENKFVLIESRIGAELQHPRPLGYNKYNSGIVIGKFDAMAALLELPADEDSRPGVVSREELRTAMRTNEGIEKLLHGLKNYVKPPSGEDAEEGSLDEVSDFPLDILDKLLREDEERKAADNDQEDRHSPTSSAGESSIPASTNPNSLSSSIDNGDFRPAAWNALETAQIRHNDNENEDIHSVPSSAFSSRPVTAVLRSVPSSNPRKPTKKLRPHDVNKLSPRLIETINIALQIEERNWKRVSWLPALGPRGLPDPGELHPRGDPWKCPGPRDCYGHAVTDTRTGLAAILAVDSGAAAALMMLGVSDEAWHRFNYNFRAYGPDVLGLPENIGEKRTIEFREAGGSLDAEWIIVWTRICVGLLRWCRDAKVTDFLDVLDKVVEEEDRRRDRPEDDDDDQIYDVCDLLEDLCLFSEAEFVRRRERRSGPPR
ncbi:putative amidoligase enzyme-domain-containing protein [Xylariaceae sp. FL1651]|nr:putative amidoligase enzyme-domain-containing protein [Xylariaceae sp. FL1651]